MTDEQPETAGAMDARTQQAMTPADAQQRLEQGNLRFREGKSRVRDHRQQVAETATEQAPFAAVLGCIDSRSGAELVFDQGIGDVFHLRVGGNCLSGDVLGGLEFACKIFGSKLIVVLGHSRCGAILSACGDVRLGNLTGLLAKLRPAVESTVEPIDPTQRTVENAEFLQAVAVRNVEMTVAGIRLGSEILRDMEQQGSIQIVGAMYDVQTGNVQFL